MKTVRQIAILDIIAEKNVETQEQLAEALKERGIQVTQATVSRDIKELRLVKVLSPDGVSCYAQPEEKKSGMADRFIRMLTESLLSVNASGNMIVIKTLPGVAGAACEAMDGLNWPEVLGSIAGENTIFLVARAEAEVPEVVRRIQDMMK